jgi:hypothetical protein
MPSLPACPLDHSPCLLPRWAVYRPVLLRNRPCRLVRTILRVPPQSCPQLAPDRRFEMLVLRAGVPPSRLAISTTYGACPWARVLPRAQNPRLVWARVQASLSKTWRGKRPRLRSGAVGNHLLQEADLGRSRARVEEALPAEEGEICCFREHHVGAVCKLLLYG